MNLVDSDIVGQVERSGGSQRWCITWGGKKRSGAERVVRYPGAPLTGVCMRFSRRGMANNLQIWFGFRPRFGQQPDLAPEAAPEQQPPQPVDAVADDADGPYRPAPGVAAPGIRRLGRRAQVAWGNPAVMGVFHPGAIGQGQQRRHRQQPASGGRSAPDRSFWSCPTSSPGF